MQSVASYSGLLSKSSKFFLYIITGFLTRVTRQVPRMEQELLTIPEHLCTLPVFSGLRVARSLLFCVMLWIVACPFHLAIVVSVLLLAVSGFSKKIQKVYSDVVTRRTPQWRIEKRHRSHNYLFHYHMSRK